MITKLLNTESDKQILKCKLVFYLKMEELSQIAAYHH